MTLTVARATCLLTYEPATGVFRWLVPNKFQPAVRAEKAVA